MAVVPAAVVALLDFGYIGGHSIRVRAVGLSDAVPMLLSLYAAVVLLAYLLFALCWGEVGKRSADRRGRDLSH